MCAGRDAAEFRDGVRRQLKEAMVARDSEDIEPLRVALEAAIEAALEPEDTEPARRLLAKLEAQWGPLAFTDLPRPETERLLAAASRGEAVEILMQCMSLSLDDGFQSEILTEFHYHNFMFCQRNRFSPEKTSTFLSIMKAVHSRAIMQDKLPEAMAREIFEDLVRRHGRHLPPYSVGVLSQGEALAVKEYACRSFFRHYKMYAFAYARRQDLCVRIVEEPVALKVPAAAALHRCHELDPREVPELQDLFIDPEASVGCGDGLSPSATDGRKAKIEAAIDEAVQAHLGRLGPRLAGLPG